MSDNEQRIKTWPIGIDSEVEHVQSETDRVDALYMVATGPMGHQEVNYHLIDQQTLEEREHRTLIQSLPRSPEPITQENSLTLQSPPQLRRTVDFSHLEEVIQPKSSDMSSQWMQHTPSGNDNGIGRFSLPEIDSSNRQEMKHRPRRASATMPPIQRDQSFRDTKVALAATSTITVDGEREKPLLSPLPDPPQIEIPERCRPELNNVLQSQNSDDHLLPFYTLSELAQHNVITDAWVSIFQNIYDITPLFEQTRGTGTFTQFVNHAGEDISSWFDEETREPRTRIDPQSHEPVSLVDHLSAITTLGTPFWQNERFLIGRLTLHPRHIRLVHAFAPSQEYLFEVAEEETLRQIARKFLKYNAHMFSYTWRYQGRTLDLNQTLTENDLPSEEQFHNRHGWPSDGDNCPTIVLHFSDDLTVA